jgi:LuxR family maltose regulon positive regulatory protein
VISAKLDIPRTSTKLVDRARLIGELDHGACRQVTVVSGPAGSGKTALLASWLGGRTFLPSAAWVSLDIDDAEPARLWAYLRTALERSAGVSVPASSTVDDVVAAVEALPEPVVLVLDNVGCLPAGAAVESLVSLVRHPLPMLHLVLSTRGHADLPLGRLRLAGELAEIDADDLAFTPAETAELWRLRGMSISDDEAAALVERTEGWAAGVCPAASEEAVTDFLRGEVLAGLTDDVRDFLLRTSIVDSFSGELAAELTGRADAPRLLERLRADDIFVRAAGADLAYRRPFREFLRHEAGVELAADLPDMHRRAAGWYADHGDPLTAIRHASDAGDWAHAASLTVHSAVSYWSGPDRPELCRVVDRMPATSGSDAGPEVAAARAMGAAVRGEPVDGDALTRVVVAREHGDLAALRAAANRLPETGPPRAVALEAIGTVRLWEGALDDADRTLAAATSAADRAGMDVTAADAAAGRALVQVLRGRPHLAAELVGPHETVLGHLALALVHWLWGDAEEARRHVGAARATRPADVALLTIVRARLLRSAGDVAGARAVLAAPRSGVVPPLLRDWATVVEAEVRLAEEHPVTALRILADLVHLHDPHPLAGPACVAAARALLATGAPARAGSLLEALQRSGAPLGLGARVDAWLVGALAAERLGHPGAVSIALAESLAAAVPESLLGPFLEAGGEVTALLARHHDLLDAHRSFADQLAAVLPAIPREPIVETITEREGVVLRYLPTLLTMNEIAGELCVSPNTVKSHLRSVYRKLGVGSRRDAVHRARGLGLI